MIDVGTKVGSVLTLLPEEALSESVVGKFYHLHIETTGMNTADEANVALMLTEQLYPKFHADVVWIKIENGVIDMQLQGSPFAWALLISFLPVILSGLAIVIVLTSVWGIVSNIPSWAWALLAVGGVLIFVGPSIGKSVSGAYKSSLESQEYKSYVRSRRE